MTIQPFHRLAQLYQPLLLLLNTQGIKDVVGVEDVIMVEAGVMKGTLLGVDVIFVVEAETTITMDLVLNQCRE